MAFRAIVLVCSVVLVVLSGRAFAQSPVPLPPDDFREAYSTVQSRDIKTTGKMPDILVGIAYASAGGSFDPKAMTLTMPGRTGTNLCVLMLTRDGRYSARARYSAASLVTKQGAIAPQWPSHYDQALRAYAKEDVAIQTFTADVCDTDKAKTFLPIGLGSGGGPLVVFVNSPDSRVRAKAIESDADKSPPTLCREVEQSPRIGYTHRCDIPAAGKANRLVITATTQTGLIQSQVYSIDLSRP